MITRVHCAVSVCCDFGLISKPRTLAANTCCKQWRKNRVSVPKSCETRNWPLAIFNSYNARFESACWRKKTWPRTESASASHPNCMLIAPADKQTRKWSESTGNFTFSHSVLRCANLNIYQAMTDAWVSAEWARGEFQPFLIAIAKRSNCILRGMRVCFISLVSISSHSMLQQRRFSFRHFCAVCKCANAKIPLGMLHLKIRLIKTQFLEISSRWWSN